MSAALCTVTPNLALGAFPGFSVAQAMQAAQSLADAGVIRLDHVQICPQNAGTLDVESARRWQLPTRIRGFGCTPTHAWRGGHRWQT